MKRMISEMSIMRRGEKRSVIAPPKSINTARGRPSSAKTMPKASGSPVSISASQEGFVRLFVEEGEVMFRLLQLFVARYGSTNYSARLLSAFTKKGETPDLLNERELEILRLLATGMSNREIAEALFITVGTVKWHANHIYGKLGVKNRGQAVAKARDLQLISNSTSL
jgi:ATP/maltotriose-dependent transcriptional regulator MalT